MTMSLAGAPAETQAATTQQHRRTRRGGLLGVRFNHQVQIYATIHLVDITPSERSAAWHTDEDWDRMKTECKEAVLRARLARMEGGVAAKAAGGASQSDSDGDDDAELCLRGLEHSADASVLHKRKKRIKKAEKAVLVDPYLRGADGSAASVSPEDVASACRKATSKARRAAAEMGALDAAAAARIHAESIPDHDDDDDQAAAAATTTTRQRRNGERPRRREAMRMQGQRRSSGSVSSSSRLEPLSVDDIVKRVGELTASYPPPPPQPRGQVGDAAAAEARGGRHQRRVRGDTSPDKCDGHGGERQHVGSSEEEEMPSLAATLASTEECQEEEEEEEEEQVEVEEESPTESPDKRRRRRRRSTSSSKSKDSTTRSGRHSSLPPSDLLNRVRSIAGEVHPEALPRKDGRKDDGDDASAALLLDRVRSIAGRHFGGGGGLRLKSELVEGGGEGEKGQRQQAAAGTALLGRTAKITRAMGI